ncbi:MAG: hypothetical protein OXR73_02170, partial [Myxococcales bacterium]|nr:hypothetical protein [Myxococcales bacterium]
ALLSVPVDDVAPIVERTLREAERLKRPTVEVVLLREQLVHMMTMGMLANRYQDAVQACVEDYKRDSGFYDWQALAPDLPATERARQALGTAFERYGQTPEPLRGLSPPDAIRGLVRWVVLAIPMAARTCDVELLRSLPPLLAPFEAVDPMVATVADNARATVAYRCDEHPELAQRLWLGVLQALDGNSNVELAYLTKIRTAIGCALGAIDTMLGIETAWPDRVEQGPHDPGQLAQVYALRRMIAVQRGDLAEAQRCRVHAERLRLRYGSHEVTSALALDLFLAVMAEDLTTVRETRAAVHRMAHRYPGWSVYRDLADASYARLCGDLGGALQTTEKGLMTSKGATTHLPGASWAVVVKAEILVELGDASGAIEYGLPELTQMRDAGRHFFARLLSLPLAIAEAKLQRFEAARARAASIVEEQRSLGVVGLQLGRSYEVSARIAMLAGDADEFLEFAKLAAQCYGAGTSSALGALHARLREDAQRLGLGDIAPASNHSEPSWDPHAMESHVWSVMLSCTDRDDRARKALRLLLDAAPSERGLLFLLADGELSLAACQGKAHETATARDFAADFLERERELSDTDAVTETAVASKYDVLSEHANDGLTSYHPVLLGSSFPEQPRIAGVALIHSSVPLPDSLPALAGMLADALLDEQGGLLGA